MKYPSLAPFDASMNGKTMSPAQISSLLAFSHDSPNKEQNQSGTNNKIAKTNVSNPMLMGMPRLPNAQMKFAPPKINPSMKPQMMFPPQMPFPMMPFPPMNPGMLLPKLNTVNGRQQMPDSSPAKAVVLKCPFPECKLVWHKTKDLYKHLRDTHETDFTCPYCEKQSTCMSNFVCHVRLHTNEKPWVCPVADCDYRGRTKNHAKSHVIQNHGIKYFHKHEKFFLQDRCRKRNDSPFTIPKSLFKRSASSLANSILAGMPGMLPAMKKFPMAPMSGAFMNPHFSGVMNNSPPVIQIPPKL